MKKNIKYIIAVFICFLVVVIAVVIRNNQTFAEETEDTVATNEEVEWVFETYSDTEREGRKWEFTCNAVKEDLLGCDEISSVEILPENYEGLDDGIVRINITIDENHELTAEFKDTIEQYVDTTNLFDDYVIEFAY